MPARRPRPESPPRLHGAGHAGSPGRPPRPRWRSRLSRCCKPGARARPRAEGHRVPAAAASKPRLLLHVRDDRRGRLSRRDADRLRVFAVRGLRGASRHRPARRLPGRTASGFATSHPSSRGPCREPRPRTRSSGLRTGCRSASSRPGSSSGSSSRAERPCRSATFSGGGGKSGTWGAEGQILFTSVQARVDLRGPGGRRHSPEADRSGPSEDEVRFNWPWFLPDGKRFLYRVRLSNGEGRLKLAEPGKPPRTLGPMSSAAQYVGPGYLVFVREGALLGQRFDLDAGRLTGDPFALADR